MGGATTLTDVARAAGVSLSTASLAFSGSGPIAAATRAKVLAAAAELGYHGPNPMAASLRRGRAGVVGVVMGHAVRQSFRDPVSIQVLDGVVTTLAESGYGVLLIPSDDPCGGAGSLLTHGAMDAVIVMGGANRPSPALRALRDRGLPVVHIGGSGRMGTTVRARDKDGMNALAGHLRERGHTRVAVATLPWHAPGRSGLVDLATARRPEVAVTARRLDGLREGGIEPVAVWECGASLVEEGIAAGQGLLAAGVLAEPATALVGFSDLIAAGLLLAARERGLAVPAQMAVAGFDGVDLPWLGEDRLTTVAQPIQETGRLAAEAAVSLAQGRPASSVQLDVELRVGTTT